MTDSMTFPEFLSKNLRGARVDDRLKPGIEDLDAVTFEDPNNLFAVSPHFLKSCPGEPQDILEALVVAYNRWLLCYLKSMCGPVERCITANRVMFVEDSKNKESKADMWKGFNESLVAISGCLEDLLVHGNYVTARQRAAQRED